VRRREFITLVGGATAAWPLAARAQQAAAPTRIGYFGPNRAQGQVQVANAGFKAFRDELRALGLSEGVNFVIEEKTLDDPRGPSVAATEISAMATRRSSHCGSGNSVAINPGR
jgi:hypothetical protein